MVKNKVLWLIGIGAAIAAAYGAYWFFPQAFPIVNVSITMDRTEALDGAKKLANAHKLGPQEGYTQACAFDRDEQMQVYTELEAGGIKAFQEVVASGLYSPYQWVVRHFKPFDVNEVYFFFTPDGDLYGFSEKIAETVEGPSLPAEQARAIAEKQATQSWAVPLDEFSLVESSKDTKPNGRTDHTFVYERKTRLQDAYYRLTLSVVGDKLAGVRYSVKVPETFIKKYEQMRSANNTIATGAFFAMAFLYFILIGLSSLIFLMRKRWLLWKPAIILGSIISLLMLAMRFNELPILWMQYQTTTSFTTFIVGFVLQTIVGFMLNALIFSYIISIAEGLSRIAFGSHIQVWSLWKKEVASSPAIVGRTLGAYLLVPLFLFYEVILYMGARHYLGWWYPASTMVNPNIIATYFPWLQTTGIAIEAGIIEECLFRAIPLAAAAWIGTRYNKRNLFIAIAFVVQCLVFGAGHANYPAQPAYARLLELIVSSTIYGVIYLRFGLLTSILSHSIFDFVLGAIPLFLVTGFGAFINKLIIIFIGLIPLMIVLYARIRVRSWRDVPSFFYNSEWVPAAKQVESIKKIEAPLHPIPLQSWRMYSALAIGVIGLVLFFNFAKFKTDGPRFTETISDVKNQAKQILGSKGITLDDSWSPLVTPNIKVNDEHRFIWQQEDGHRLYNELLGRFLPCPGWDVKFVRFQGTVEERAELYSMRLGAHNKVVALSHHIIAEAPGKSLDEGAARRVALDGARIEFGYNPDDLQEITAQASKQPARTDWNFNFKDKQIQLPHDAQARVIINLIGDSMSGFGQYVHIPETWQRDWEAEQAIYHIINALCRLFLIFLLIFAIILSWWRFGISSSSVKQYSLFMMLIMVGYIFIYWCSRETILFQFNAQEPFYNQLFTIIGSMVLSILFLAAAEAGFIMASLQVKRSLLIGASKKLMVMAASLGVGISGIISLLHAYAPSRAPLWGNYNFLTCSRPWSVAWLSHTFQYAIVAAGCLLLLNLLYELEKIRWGRLLVIIVIFLSAIAATGSMELVTVPYWIIAGLTSGICILVPYYLLLRFSAASVPLLVAAIAILGSLQQGIHGLYPMALGIMIFTSFIIAQLAWGWYHIQSAE